jgi:hypothetical protein
VLKVGDRVDIKLLACLVVASFQVLQRTIIAVHQVFRKMNGENASYNPK